MGAPRAAAGLFDKTRTLDIISGIAERRTRTSGRVRLRRSEHPPGAGSGLATQPALGRGLRLACLPCALAGAVLFFQRGRKHAPRLLDHLPPVSVPFSFEWHRNRDVGAAATVCDVDIGQPCRPRGRGWRCGGRLLRWHLLTLPSSCAHAPARGAAGRRGNRANSPTGRMFRLLCEWRQRNTVDAATQPSMSQKDDGDVTGWFGREAFRCFRHLVAAGERAAFPPHQQARHLFRR